MSNGNITQIYSFLVKPQKGSASSTTTGVSVNLNGKLFDMLSDLFESTEKDCNIDIAFAPAADGSQNNAARDLLVEFASNPTLANATAVAHKLELVTTNRSGPGLLFLVLGATKSGNKMVVSRFPADTGIMADETSGALTVAFLERVFMKNARSYKAVVYKGLSKSGTWKGKAVDKQISDFKNPTSEYWIFSFLDSDFITTAAAGTMRFADALRKAAGSTTNLQVQSEIAAAGTLLQNAGGKVASIDQLMANMNYSDETKKVVKSCLKSNAIAAEAFQFDQVAFEAHFKFKTVTLDTGVSISADASKFPDLVKTSQKGAATEFSAIGRVVEQRVTLNRNGRPK